MKAKLFWIALLLLCVTATPFSVAAQDVQKDDVEVMSGGRAYKSYLAAPSSGGPHPAIVLMHSIGGLEEGYRTMSDKLAAEGFVVLAIGWQTYTRNETDPTVKQLVEDSVKLLSARKDVDPKRLGLTGFCAGGRFTMLFLPQLPSFKAGVAWYGFPNRGTPPPADFIKDLTAPMLIIHGTADQPSPIADIYKYATALQEAKKYFEMKVYFGEPHGFMLSQGQMRQDEVAMDAFNQMVDFFKRKLTTAA
ncbi:MAG: dienelactone hydrolase family protein [Anaerolineae bacterium]|nr:dienelactone hydrolase family protein [Anaerolineae bacterium]